MHNRNYNMNVTKIILPSNNASLYRREKQLIIAYFNNLAFVVEMIVPSRVILMFNWQRFLTDHDDDLFGQVSFLVIIVIIYKKNDWEREGEEQGVIEWVSDRKREWERERGEMREEVRNQINYGNKRKKSEWNKSISFCTDIEKNLTDKKMIIRLSVNDWSRINGRVDFCALKEQK